MIVRSKWGNVATAMLHRALRLRLINYTQFQLHVDYCISGHSYAVGKAALAPASGEWQSGQLRKAYRLIS